MKESNTAAALMGLASSDQSFIGLIETVKFGKGFLKESSPKKGNSVTQFESE